MSEQRDPLLESWFADGRRELADESFTSSVMAGVRARDRRVFAGRVSIAALLIALELMLDSPLQHSVSTITAVLARTLVEIDHAWVAFVLAPINSIAGVLGVLLLGLQLTWRRKSR